jgi:hypothetical protein
MDSNVNNTQKIIITIAILLGILILTLVGYSLYSRAQTAQGELARKEQLDALTKRREQETAVTLTNEAQNNPNTFENFTQGENTNRNVDNGQVFGVVSPTTDEEVAAVATKTPVKSLVKKYVAPRKVYTNSDRPLTAEEIRRIRQLPIDTSATGNLQNKLELDSNGQYKAQYK